jgi:hypothetical protein
MKTFLFDTELPEIPTASNKTEGSVATVQPGDVHRKAWPARGELMCWKGFALVNSGWLFEQAQRSL